MNTRDRWCVREGEERALRNCHAPRHRAIPPSVSCPPRHSRRRGPGARRGAGTTRARVGLGVLARVTFVGHLLLGQALVIALEQRLVARREALGLGLEDLLALLRRELAPLLVAV